MENLETSVESTSKKDEISQIAQANLDSDNDSDVAEQVDGDDGDDGDQVELKYESSDDENIEDSDLEEEGLSNEQQTSNISGKEDNNLKDLLESDVSEYSDSDNSDDDDDNFKKLENSRDLLSNVHKNLQAINYIEVEKMSKVTRDSNNNINDPYHTTLPILSKYERTKILGIRTKQINSGAKPYISADENIIDGYTIALKELNEKKIPFIIKRPISNNKFEYWKLEDLEIV